MKKYNLFLDDIRIPKDAWRHTYKTEYLRPGWYIVRSYKEFVDMIETYFKVPILEGEISFPELISFDHDLGDEHYGDGLNGKSIDYSKYQEKTGYDCAKWLVDFCMDNKLELPEYLTHTQNPVGGENIKKLFENYSKFKHEN